MNTYKGPGYLMLSADSLLAAGFGIISVAEGLAGNPAGATSTGIVAAGVGYEVFKGTRDDLPHGHGYMIASVGAFGWGLEVSPLAWAIPQFIVSGLLLIKYLAAKKISENNPKVDEVHTLDDFFDSPKDSWKSPERISW